MGLNVGDRCRCCACTFSSLHSRLPSHWTNAKKGKTSFLLFLWGKKQHSQIHFIMRNRPTPGWSSQSGNCRVSEGVPVPRLYNGLNCRNTCFRGVATYICTVLIFLVRCQTCIQCYALQVLSYSYPLSLLANMATSNLGLSHPRKKTHFLARTFFVPKICWGFPTPFVLPSTVLRRCWEAWAHQAHNVLHPSRRTKATKGRLWGGCMRAYKWAKWDIQTRYSRIIHQVWIKHWVPKESSFDYTKLNDEEMPTVKIGNHGAHHCKYPHQRVKPQVELMRG